MKKLKVLILCLGMMFSQAQIVQVVKENYQLEYNFKAKQPHIVEYTVQCDGSFKCLSRPEFKRELYTPSNKQYSVKGFDRGHMVPYETLCCREQGRIEAQSLYNVVLQDSRLNRGVWKTLEEVERRLSRKMLVHVRVEVFYSSTAVNGITVPIGFKKIVKFGDKKRVFYFENKPPKSKNLKDFEIE